MHTVTLQALIKNLENNMESDSTSTVIHILFVHKLNAFFFKWTKGRLYFSIVILLCSSISVCIYCQIEHNFQNTTHSNAIYYMFQPFWPSLGIFYNIRGKEYQDGGPPPQYFNVLTVKGGFHLGILFHVCCHKIYLMMVQRVKTRSR